MLRRLGLGLALVILMAGAGARAQHLPLPPASLFDVAAQNPREALRAGKAWLTAATEAGRAREQLQALTLLVDAAGRLEEPVTLAHYARQGLALAERLDDTGARARFLMAQADAIEAQGDPKAGWPLHLEAVRLAESQGDPAVQADVFYAQGLSALTNGSIEDAQTYAMRAVTLYQRLGPPYRLAAALMAVGNLHESLGDWDKSLRYSLEAKALLPPKRYPFQESVVLYNLGVTYVRQKKIELAKEQFERALELSIQIDDEQGIAYAHHRLAVVANESGHPDIAEAHAGTALPYFAAAGNKLMQLMAMLTLTEAQTAQKDRHALQTLADARPLTTTLDEEAQTAYLEQSGRTRAAFGDYRGAYQDLLAAHTKARETFHKLSSKRLHEQLARFDAQRKDTENALLRKEQSLQQVRLAQAATETQRLVLLLIVAVLVVGIVAYALIVQVQQRRRLSTLALHDELTGLPNRRSILAYGEEQLARAAAQKTTVCFAVVDLDHFKRVNDSYGHGTGDRVLQAFTERCAPLLRGDDRLGRLGGEEFLFVLPRLARKRLPAIFARLQASLRDLDVEGLPPDYVLTVSMGAIVAGDGPADLNALLHRADEALYRAKNEGRNCLRFADEGDAPRPALRSVESAGKDAGREVAVAAVTGDEDDGGVLHPRAHPQGDR